MGSMDCKPGHITLGLHSRWIGETQVRVKVRKIGHSNKIAVDLQVLSPEVTYGATECQLRKIACNAAQLYSVSSFDYSVLSDIATERKAQTLSGDCKVTYVRNLSLAFQGVGI